MTLARYGLQGFSSKLLCQSVFVLARRRMSSCIQTKPHVQQSPQGGALRFEFIPSAARTLSCCFWSAFWRYEEFSLQGTILQDAAAAVGFVAVNRPIGTAGGFRQRRLRVFFSVQAV